MPAQIHVHNTGLARERASEVQAFLNRFARSLFAGNGAEVAAMWEVPAMVIGPDHVLAMTSLIDVATLMTKSKEEYNKRGIMNTRAHIVALEWIGDRASDRVAVVKVRWPYLDAKGKELGGEAADYTLRRDDKGELKVRVVLMRGVDSTRH